MSSPLAPYPAWAARRLVLFAAGTLLACYVAVFAADGRTITPRLLVDALANCVAGVVAAAVALQACRALPWRLSDRWWFLLVHLVAAALFGVVWFWATAIIVGSTALLDGHAWRPFLLTGPALHWQAFTAFVLYFTVASGYYMVQASGEARNAAALRHESELAALRARLNPHVLLNTLHALLELVNSRDARAEEAVERFARVVRYTSNGTGTDDPVPLASEHAMLQDYLALEALRLGPRLTYEFDWSPAVDAVPVPALTLQPIVENAVRHGVAPRPGKGRVVVRAHVRDRRVHVYVEDDGLGAAASSVGSGAGLDLVRRRLAARHGDRLTFSAGPADGGAGWRVHIAFPAP